MNPYPRNQKTPILSRVTVSARLDLLISAAVVLTIMAWPHTTLAGVSQTRQAELLYVLQQDCGSCHGLTMKGGLGSPLLPEAFTGQDIQEIADVILDGVPGTPMAPWRALLSEDEARWMAKAIKAGTVLSKP